MRAQIRAIDLLFHCTSRRHAERGLNCFHSPALSLAQMDSAGIEGAFVSQCKKWSCERQWMCVDTRLDDVLHYTQTSPRFFGLAGYNPFDIAESMREIELAVARHGFRGVFVHAASFGLPLTGALMYPLFAKAVELGVPVVAQLTDLPHSEDLRRLFKDFPELVLVLAATRPAPREMSAIADECEDAYFALDPAALAHLAGSCGTGLRPVEAANFLIGPLFQERCIWGSNGVPWADAVSSTDSLATGDWRPATFFRDNAVRVFALGRPLPARIPRSELQEIIAAE